MNIPVFNSVLTTASQDSGMKIKKTNALEALWKSEKGCRGMRLN